MNISGYTIFDAIVIGTIRVDSLQRDIVTSQLTGRYGLTDRVQLDFQAPYVYRKDTTVRGVGSGMNVTENTVTGNGIGDLEGTVEYQPIVGHGSIPDTTRNRRQRPAPKVLPRPSSSRGGSCPIP